MTLHWMSTLLGWFLIGIALILPACLFLTHANLSNATTTWRGHSGFTVYFYPGTPSEHIDVAAARMKKFTAIELVRIVTAEEALQDFILSSNLGEVAKSMKKNPLPASATVVTKDFPIGGLEPFIRQIENWDGVEEVVVEELWLKRLNALRSMVGRLGGAFGIVLGVGAVFISAATVRMSIEYRLAEIRVFDLLGGVDRFLKRPFMYCGILYGVGGGIVSALLLSLVSALIAAPIQELQASYSEAIPLLGINPAIVSALMIAGCVLGWVGASYECRKRIWMIRQEEGIS